MNIQDVKLFPQGYSAIALHPELLRDEPSVLLMDIDGWTVDLMRLDNHIPNAATCRSLELGMIRCIDEIKEQLRRDVGCPSPTPRSNGYSAAIRAAWTMRRAKSL